MPTTKQMLERYKELMETTKHCYILGHIDKSEYFIDIETHYNYIKAYIGAVYVYDFMKDKKFNALSDEVYNIYNEYQDFDLVQYEYELAQSE